MPPLQLMIKPSSGNCNLRCKYCFYTDEMNKRETPNYGFMSQETLEIVVTKALQYCEGSCSFAFQGGEPSLVGLPFYEKLIELEQTRNVRHVQVFKSMQTNGYGFTKEWAAFLGQNKFLVGLSVDGVKHTHDAYRVDPSGNGTFASVMDTTRLFDQAGVDYNILTVVNKATASRVKKIYDFYKKNGWKYQQYIACLDPYGETCGTREYSLTPKLYGEFLTQLFDLWYQDLQKGQQPYIRQFENYMDILLGRQPEACDQRGHCGVQYVVEADGSVYPCDFYVMDGYKIGNLREDSFEEINRRAMVLGFIEKSLSHPEECKKCPYGYLCRGGCRRHREMAMNGELGKNYFCEAYRQFFQAALPRMQSIAAALRRRR